MAAAGPIPVLMAGGAQALMRNPSAGQGQGRSVDRTTLDGFVREQLEPTLMKMQPRDGAAADPEYTWCLADDDGESVLFYSLAGASITLLRALSRNSYTGLCFDLRTGATRPLEAPVSGAGRHRHPETHCGAVAAAAVSGARRWSCGDVSADRSPSTWRLRRTERPRCSQDGTAVTLPAPASAESNGWRPRRRA